MDFFRDVAATHGLSEDTPGFVALRRADSDTSVFTVGVQDESADPITAATNFRIASITKQFTAAAVLRLVEEGRLTLDTAMLDVFPGLPPHFNGVVIRHLLTHRSGLPDYESFFDKSNGEPFRDGQVIDFLATCDAVEFPPGSKYQYSNTAYCLLAVLVSRLSQRPFGAYLQQELFAPAGMKFAALNGTTDIPDRAYGFSRKDGHWRVTDQNRLTTSHGDGGIYTSAPDLVQWQTALYQEGAVLAPESVNLMTTGHTESNYEGELYGFGVARTELAGHTCFLHHGVSLGFETALFYVPERRLSLVLLANVGDIGLNMITEGRRFLSHELGA